MSSLVGQEALIQAFARFGQEAEQMLKDETEASGRDIEADAKRRAPVNMGQLRQSINYQKADGGKTAKIAVNAKYGAYVEFGTRSKVNVPAEMKDIAMQYKGTGGGGGGSGDFKNSEFFKDILDWVKKKGIVGVYSVKTRKRAKRRGVNEEAETESVAFLIAMSILKKGISPQPYLYPAFVKGRNEYITRLSAELQRLTQKFR